MCFSEEFLTDFTRLAFLVICIHPNTHCVTQNKPSLYKTNHDNKKLCEMRSSISCEIRTEFIGKLIDDFVNFASRIRLGPGSTRGLGLRKR